MIRKHYAHVITDLRGGQLTGSARAARRHGTSCAIRGKRATWNSTLPQRGIPKLNQLVHSGLSAQKSVPSSPQASTTSPVSLSHRLVYSHSLVTSAIST